MKIPKRLNKTEKKTFALIDEFDRAARVHGLMEEWEYGKCVSNAQLDFDKAKEALTNHINRLHNKIRKLEIKPTYSDTYHP